MNLLVIDDQKETLDYVVEFLEMEGFQVTGCSQSYESIRILGTQKVDCVITDLKMPILEGDDLIQIIRSKYPTMPIIVLSGHVPSEHKLKEMGVFAVLNKPVEPSQLIQAVWDGIAEFSNQITFQFDHINLKKIKDSVNIKLVKIALKRTKGNQVKASKLLGISRQSLIRYVKQYQLR